MVESEVLFWASVTGVLSALATGLGALPVAWLGGKSKQVRALSGAVAAGMMISASVFSLAQKGIEMRSTRPSAPFEVIGGLLLGAWFFWLVERRLAAREDPLALSLISRDRKGLLLFLAMFVHSIPEGVAIGVGFATGDFQFGLVMAMAISVHNIPEGVAISLPLRASGASLARCAGVSILSSLPQPLTAIPAALAAWFFQPLLPSGLGFAGGAMVYLVVAEMIPDALEAGGRTLTSWGVMGGLAGMLLITTLLDMQCG